MVKVGGWGLGVGGWGLGGGGGHKGGFFFSDRTFVSSIIHYQLQLIFMILLPPRSLLLGLN